MLLSRFLAALAMAWTLQRFAWFRVEVRPCAQFRDKPRQVLNHEARSSRRLCFPGFPSCTFVPLVVHGLQTDPCQDTGWVATLQQSSCTISDSNFQPWPTLSPFAPFVMTQPGSRFHKSSLSPTTRSRRRCRMATTLPARTTWCASSWAKSTPATIRAKTGTPVRHNFFADWRRAGHLPAGRPALHLPLCSALYRPGRNH